MSVVLVHAGICDASMWEGFDVPAARAHELRGFGSTPMPDSGVFSHVDDLEAALEGEPAALVGASYGGQVCLALAATRPALVERLVLIDAPLPDHDWSRQILDYAEEEDRLLEEGDLDAAAELNARFWAPAVADRVVPMTRLSFELQVASQAEDEEPDTIDLTAVSSPALVIVGDGDKPDFRAISERLARELSNAQLAVVAGAAHLPVLERPEQTARLIREFLR